MKDQLTKLLSSALKYLVGVGVAFLVGRNLLTPDDAKAIDAEAVTAITALSGFLAMIVVAIGQAIYTKLFPGLSEKAATFPGQGNNRSGAAGGPLLLAGVCTAAGLMGLGLPSCSGVVSDYAGTSPVPFRIGILGPDGTVSYSSKGGLAVELDLNRQDANRRRLGAMPGQESAK